MMQMVDRKVPRTKQMINLKERNVKFVKGIKIHRKVKGNIIV